MRWCCFQRQTRRLTGILRIERCATLPKCFPPRMIIECSALLSACPPYADFYAAQDCACIRRAIVQNSGLEENTEQPSDSSRFARTQLKQNAMYLYFEDDGAFKAGTVLSQAGSAYQVELTTGRRSKSRPLMSFFPLRHRALQNLSRVFRRLLQSLIRLFFGKPRRQRNFPLRISPRNTGVRSLRP